MLDWLFGNGIGTNIGASMLWAVAGYLVAKRVRAELARLHARHDAHAAHLDSISRSLDDLHGKLDR
jgi:hypothetical protein